MSEKISHWLERHWWGLIVAYGLVVPLSYVLAWTIVEPLDLYAGLQGSPAFAKRLVLQLGLTFLLAANIVIVLELFFRKKTWHTPPIRLVKSFDEVRAALTSVVNEAQQIVITAGSRSRDSDYFRLIEQKLKAHPALIYYRVLYGFPHNQVFKDHLLEIRKIRDPSNRDHGYQTVFMGLFHDSLKEPENSICANEKKAVIVLPSVNGIGHFDTALVIEEEAYVQAILRFVKDLYNAGTRCEQAADIEKLTVLRSANESDGR